MSLTNLWLSSSGRRLLLEKENGMSEAPKRSKNLHKRHPGLAIVLFGMATFWGLLGLGYLLSPAENIVRVGTLEYVNQIHRHFWSVSMLGVAILMLYGARDIDRRAKLLRFTLSVGCLLCLLRGALTTLPYFIDVFVEQDSEQAASFGGFAVYLFVLFVHFAALMEPFRNPLTES